MSHTEQEKTDIVMQYQQGISIQELSIKYNISARTIYRWAKIYCPSVPDKNASVPLKSIMHFCAESPNWKT